MKILVMSSDNEKDTFELFHYCMEKNWPNHPEIIYSTEALINPYYRTICKDYPLPIWSKRIRETIKEIDDKYILIMCDDIFIRQQVDNNYILSLQKYIDSGIACLHFEQSFVRSDNTLFNNDWYNCTSWIRRSNMVALWDKEHLLARFNADLDPWALENLPNTGEAKHLISNGKDVFDWGKNGKGYRCWGIFRGKWAREAITYAQNNNIKLDLSRGVQEQMPTPTEDTEWKQRLALLDTERTKK